MAKDGKIATWIGQGVGTMKKDGTVSYRGAVCYQTSSPRCWRTRIRAYRSNDYTSKREIDIEMTRMMSRA